MKHPFGKFHTSLGFDFSGGGEDINWGYKNWGRDPKIKNEGIIK